MVSLVVTAHYNTSVSEQIPVCAVWFSGTAQSYRARIVLAVARSSSVSANIFLIQLTDICCLITVTNSKAFFNILINHYTVCE